MSVPRVGGYRGITLRNAPPAQGPFVVVPRESADLFRKHLSDEIQGLRKALTLGRIAPRSEVRVVAIESHGNFTVFGRYEESAHIRRGGRVEFNAKCSGFYRRIQTKPPEITKLRKSFEQNFCESLRKPIEAVKHYHELQPTLEWWIEARS